MSEAAGYYSVIQYCPDRSRAEAANIGVLLYVPGRRDLKVRLSRGNDRARRFFKKDVDLRWMKAAKDSFRSRIEREAETINSLSDLEDFISTRANDFLLTPPRSMRVIEASDAELEALFHDLVGGRSLARRREKRLRQQLDVAFRSPTLENRIRFDETVILPVLGRKFVAPYAYKNGALNLIKPQAFPGTERGATRTASELAVDGDLLRRHRESDGVERRLVVIASFPTSLGSAASGIGNLLDEYGVRVVSGSDVASFIAEVERNAHT